jgi:hypothetical protein
MFAVLILLDIPSISMNKAYNFFYKSQVKQSLTNFFRKNYQQL